MAKSSPPELSTVSQGSTVNRRDVDEVDLQLLLSSDIGVVIIEEAKLDEARQIISELKGQTG